MISTLWHQAWMGPSMSGQSKPSSGRERMSSKVAYTHVQLVWRTQDVFMELVLTASWGSWMRCKSSKFSPAWLAPDFLCGDLSTVKTQACWSIMGSCFCSQKLGCMDWAQIFESNVALTQIAMCGGGALLFAGTETGAIRAYSYPLTGMLLLFMESSCTSLSLQCFLSQRHLYVPILRCQVAIFLDFLSTGWNWLALPVELQECFLKWK